MRPFGCFAPLASRYACTDAAQAAMDRSLLLARRCRGGGCTSYGFDDLARRHRRGPADEEMTTKADQLVDRAADHLQQMADSAASEGGLAAKFAQPLADDAAFLRKLKPSLIKARAKGRAPKNQQPAHGTVHSSGRKTKRPGGPSPFIFVGLAFAGGILLAKIIDWKNDANPDD